MNRSEDLLGKIRQLRERLSRLSEASLRINESLDLDTVLQGVLDSARSLTNARYGVMTLLDGKGQLEKFLSSGMTREDAARLWEVPHGMKFVEYLGNITHPFRVSDLQRHIREAGLPELHCPLNVSPMLSFLTCPVLHWGEHIGNIYLAEKENEKEFTGEDEEILVMFASQAALVVSNARRYRDEQRARADLETLINTSPVGVAVFDARTGYPVSLNREARRIVDVLREPNQSTEQLLDVLTFVREDGREVSLMEFSMAELLSIGETVRAEEIVMRVPSGRSVRTLLNATPIRSEDGEVDSFVFTLQDMSSQEELERMRAEFLAMVSHELRAPLTSIKGSAATVLGAPTEMDPAVVTQFFRIIEDQADHMHGLVADLLDIARIETGTLSISPEPADVNILVDRAKTAFSSSGGRNRLAIDIDPDLPFVLADRRRIIQVLVNLLSNAARHSPKSSVIRVSVVPDDVHVAVSVTDEGRGIPAESLPHLFRKFSRVHYEEQGSDTGLGLAVCKGIVEAHGGRIWAESEGPGLGARFTFTIPTVDQPVSDSAGIPGPGSRRSSRREGQLEQERLRVLVVDDNPEDLRHIGDTLAQSGYVPIVTGDPEEVILLIQEEKPSLIILDLMLPGTDGIKLMTEIVETSEVPVIFLSIYEQEDVIARAFDSGAADYVVKPFSPTELLARVRAALRRQAKSEPTKPYVHGELMIDYDQHRVTLAGRLVPLVSMEFKVLAELSAHGGRVVTYENLLQRVWGRNRRGDLRPMRTIMSKLRRKLDDDANHPTYIFTEPRVGYRMPMAETMEKDASPTP